jgi:hypothetical protein
MAFQSGLKSLIIIIPAALTCYAALLPTGLWAEDEHEPFIKDRLVGRQPGGTVVVSTNQILQPAGLTFRSSRRQFLVNFPRSDKAVKRQYNRYSREP